MSNGFAEGGAHAVHRGHPTRRGADAQAAAAAPQGQARVPHLTRTTSAPTFHRAAWADESNIQDGRYIYSFRGNGGSELHRYDIALNTWLTVLYSPQMETFSTGSGYESDERYVYIRKDAAHRFFKYEVVGN